MPKVSVIIPTYNCAHYLPNALQSVLRQTFTDYEIIIVDDGSTDNTREVIEPFVVRFPSRIRYIYSHQERSAARNRGIQTAEGEYIAFLVVEKNIHLTAVSNDRRPQRATLRRNDS